MSSTLHHTRRLLNHLYQLDNNNHYHNHILHWHYTQLDDDHTFQIHGQTLFYLFILSAIILLVTLLLLYARWYFRFRHLHATHAPPPFTSERVETNEVCRGVDPMVIQTMPIILHQESSVEERDDQMECCICLGVFEDGDKVKVLPQCRHRFHSDCVDRWLLGQASCPLCRMVVRVNPPSLHSALDSV